MGELVKIHTEDLDELRYGGKLGQYECMEYSFVDKDRWSSTFKLVIKSNHDNTYYQTFYQEPATEYQDNDRWEEDSEGYVTLTQVYPKKVEKIEYVTKED